MTMKQNGETEREKAIPSSGMTARVFRGSIWGIGGQAVALLSSLIVTPVVIRNLGAESYGILALINTLIGYLAFADVGMGLASTKFASEAYASQDRDREISVVWTSLLVSGIPITLCTLALVFGAEKLVADVFQLPVHLQGDAAFALRLAAIGLLASAMAGILNTPQLVRLRLDLTTMITSGGYLIQGLVTITVLMAGGRLIGATAAITGASIALALSHGIVSSRLLPGLLKPRLRRDLIKPLFYFGAAILVSALAGALTENGERFLLVRLTTVKALAYYSVAFTLARLVSVVPVAMTQTLVPAFSRLKDLPDTERLSVLFSRASRALILIIVPLALLLSVASKTIIGVWIDPDFADHCVLPAGILIGGWVFRGLSCMPRSLLTAYGRNDLIARYNIVEALPYIAATGYLTHVYGTTGAAIAWSARVFLESSYIFYVAAGVSRFRLQVMPKNRSAFALALVILGIPPAVILARPELNPSLILAGTVTMAAGLYALLMWRSIIDSEERAWLRASFLARLNR